MNIVTLLCCFGILCISLGETQRAARKADINVPKARIVSGKDVSITDFRYQLSLACSGNHFCGASIIHIKWALTSAYCTTLCAAGNILIRAGSASRSSGGSTHTAAQMIKHPDFSLTTRDYDIALLKVTPTFGFSGTTQSIPLMKANTYIPDLLFTSTKCTVSGWGATSGAIPENLQAATDLLINRNSLCRYQHIFGQITNQMLCAGAVFDQRPSCQGDHGGPLVATLDGLQQQIGIVSWGYRNCDRVILPVAGVYTNVSSLRKWVADNTAGDLPL